LKRRRFGRLAGLDGESVWQLLDEESVTRTAGVPTVWLMLLAYMRETGKTLRTVDKVIIGGAAAPRTMIEEFQDRHGTGVIHAWGMTETSPLGTVGTLKGKHAGCTAEEKLALQLKQGRGVAAVELRIVDDNGRELPRDGVAFGELQVRGPWVVKEYFKGPLLVVVPAAGQEPTKQELLTFLSDRVAKWWLPDDVVFVDELPHTATGKVSKLNLRKRFEDYRLPV